MDLHQQAEDKLIRNTLIAVVTTACVNQNVEYEHLKVKKNGKKRVWSRPLLLERNNLGICPIASSFRNNETINFKRFLKMSEENFEELLKRVSPLIKKMIRC